MNEPEKHVKDCRCPSCEIGRSCEPHPYNCQCDPCKEQKAKSKSACDPSVALQLKMAEEAGAKSKAEEARILCMVKKEIPPKHSTVLVSFESGHYKKITGKWKGDTVWTHWIKPDGKILHINKDKVEYFEEL